MEIRFKHLPMLLLLTVIILWCVMLLFIPYLSSIEQQPQPLSHSLYTAYAHICHQYDSRSLHLCGNKLPVCARCSGVYFGFLIGSVGAILMRRRLTGQAFLAWGICVSPMLVDVLLNVLGVHDSTILTRVLTGLFFGIGASIIIVPLLIEGMKEILTNSFYMKGVLRESKT